jgi:hypothetical protein
MKGQKGRNNAVFRIIELSSLGAHLAVGLERRWIDVDCDVAQFKFFDGVLNSKLEKRRRSFDNMCMQADKSAGCRLKRMLLQRKSTCNTMCVLKTCFCTETTYSLSFSVSACTGLLLNSAPYLAN